jgi:hypothetical protein
MKIPWHMLVKARCYAASFVIHVVIIAILSLIILTEKTASTGNFQLNGGFLTAPGDAQDFEVAGSAEQIQTATISVQSFIKPTDAVSHPKLVIVSTAADLPTSVHLPQATAGPVLQNFSEAKSSVGNGSGAGNIWAGTGSGIGSGRKINFFGIQDEAEKVVFLIDISGSMISADKGGHEGFSRVKEEFRSLIGNIHTQSSFNVVLFGSQAFCFQTQAMLQATPENKEAAYQWILPIHNSKQFHQALGSEIMESLYVPTIRGMPEGGGTRMDLALLAAFEMKPDAIFILSDGAPSIAGWNAPEVLNKVSAWKKQIFLGQKEPKIHVVSYEADGAGNNFMQSLASRHSGKFLRIKSFHKQGQVSYRN